MLFSQFSLKAGMLRETGLVPLAAHKVLVRHLPQHRQPSRHRGEIKMGLCQKPELNLLRWFPR